MITPNNQAKVGLMVNLTNLVGWAFSQGLSVGDVTSALSLKVTELEVEVIEKMKESKIIPPSGIVGLEGGVNGNRG